MNASSFRHRRAVRPAPQDPPAAVPVSVSPAPSPTAPEEVTAPTAPLAAPAGRPGPPPPEDPPLPVPPRRAGFAVRAVLAGLAAAVCVAGAWMLEQQAVGTGRGQRLDELILMAAQADTSFVARLVLPAISTVTVPVIIAILATSAVLCLARRRVGLMVQLAVMAIGANVTTQVVKHGLIDRENLADGLAITPNSFPSGHTTFAAAAAVAIVLAVPSRIRSLTACLATAWTVAAGVGTIAAGWHRPSDVVGAVMVVGAWTFLIVLVDSAAAAAGIGAPPELPAAGRGRGSAGVPSRSGTAGMVVLLAVALVSLAGAALLGAGLPTPLQLEDTAHQGLAYAAAILAILGGTSAVVAVVLALRVEHGPR
ncbi:phosphatase PAP2 family protein [Brachybacterium hainanense]|uniref:Phosphatase PAP2 family protein n=1 Tax=Brachybacterium hainanense TaxID=1541174 RepID=A0ABV6RF40_9MICO